jgi:hypothetical protein
LEDLGADGKLRTGFRFSEMKGICEEAAELLFAKEGICSM